jgi:hypothetical protein
MTPVLRYCPRVCLMAVLCAAAPGFAQERESPPETNELIEFALDLRGASFDDAGVVTDAQGIEHRLADVGDIGKMTARLAAAAARQPREDLVALARDWLLAASRLLAAPDASTGSDRVRLLAGLAEAHMAILDRLSVAQTRFVRAALLRHSSALASAPMPSDGNEAQARAGAIALAELSLKARERTPILEGATGLFRDGFEPSSQPACGTPLTPGNWQHTAIAAQGGDFSVSFDAIPSIASIDALVALSNGTPTSFGGLAAIVAFDNNGRITARNGGGYPASNIQYIAGKRYRFRLEVHVQPRVYSVYVTPEGGSEVQIGSNYAFRTEQAAVPSLDHRVAVVAGNTGTLSVCNFSMSAAGPARVVYGYRPPSQLVGGGTNTYPVPAGFIHQTSWTSSGGPDIEGVYTHDFGAWTAMVWRWADTMRSDAIQRLPIGPGTQAPVYRFELTQNDHASPGTNGDHPRAEFFSVDPEEDRRGRTPPRSNIIREGDEYWATFAIHLAPDFPLNHRWATLAQRKFQNGLSAPSQWFTLDVHKGKLEYTEPRGTLYEYKPLADLTAIRGRWVQITIHEIASSGSGGLFEVYLDGALKGRRVGPTIDAGDINYNFHYGYYRANEPARDESVGPGIGVLYETPLLIRRGSNPAGIAAVPVLP